MATLIIVFFYGGFLALLSSALFFAVRAFQNRPSWGQMRLIGVTAALFVWIEIIFHLAVFENAISFVSFVLDLPVWFDLVVAGSVLIVVATVYFRLKKRNTFNNAAFVALVLIPLGIPSIQMIGKLIRAGSSEVVVMVGGFLVKKPHVIPIPLHVNVAVYGEKITSAILLSRGYVRIESHVSGNQGIDGIFVKYAPESKSKRDIAEVIIEETKVGSGRLAQGQMTKGWINDRLEVLRVRPRHDVSSRSMM